MQIWWTESALDRTARNIQYLICEGNKGQGSSWPKNIGKYRLFYQSSVSVQCGVVERKVNHAVADATWLFVAFAL